MYCRTKERSTKNFCLTNKNFLKPARVFINITVNVVICYCQIFKHGKQRTNIALDFFDRVLFSTLIFSTHLYKTNRRCNKYVLNYKIKFKYKYQFPDLGSVNKLVIFRIYPAIKTYWGLYSFPCFFFFIKSRNVSEVKKLPWHFPQLNINVLCP